MSEKYVFRRSTERLFGTAYEFRNEAEKDTVLGVLSRMFPGVTATRTFVNQGVQPFTVAHMTERLREADATPTDLDGLARAFAEMQRAAEQAAERRLAQTRARAEEVERERQRQAAVLERQREQERQRQAEAAQQRQAEEARQVSLAQERQRQEEQARRKQQQTTRGQTRAGIRERCEARNIQTLTHFTRVENVQSILTHGLISHAALNGRGIINDYDRYDRKTYANCLSITSPNYRMFYRQRMGNPRSEWAVLLLDPSLLWELDCGFTEINAADSLVSRRTDDEIRGPEAFERLFGNDTHRNQWKITPSEPTNPQSEVLCFETIPPRYITAVHLQQTPRTVFQSGDGRRIPHTISNTHFLYRHDFEAWR